MDLKDGWLLRQGKVASVHVKLKSILLKVISNIPDSIRDKNESFLFQYAKELLIKELNK